MLGVAGLDQEPTPWYADPAWWALGISILSIAMSGVVAVRGAEPLLAAGVRVGLGRRATLRSVRTRLDPQIAPDAVGNLWTPTFDSELSSLQDSIGSLSDRKMRKDLKVLVTSLEKLRGKGQPGTEPDGRPKGFRGHNETRWSRRSRLTRGSRLAWRRPVAKASRTRPLGSRVLSPGSHERPTSPQYQMARLNALVAHRRARRNTRRHRAARPLPVFEPGQAT